MSAGPRRFRVGCLQESWEHPRCRWVGYRTADSPEQAAARPCPSCGSRVDAASAGERASTHQLTIPR